MQDVVINHNTRAALPLRIPFNAAIQTQDMFSIFKECKNKAYMNIKVDKYIDYKLLCFSTWERSKSHITMTAAL